MLSGGVIYLRMEFSTAAPGGGFVADTSRNFMFLCLQLFRYIQLAIIILSA